MNIVERFQDRVSQIRSDSMRQQVLLDLSDRLDAAKKKASSDVSPKPCGKGWVGTKPPGCKRSGKSEGATKPATEKSPAKKKPATTTKKKSSSKALVSKSELLEVAKEFGIKGASKMNSSDLFNAVTSIPTAKMTGKKDISNNAGDFSDIGQMMTLQPSDITYSPGDGAKQQFSLIAKSSSKVGWDPAIVIQDKQDKYKYQALDEHSSNIVGGAKDRALTVVMPDVPKQVSLAKTLSSHPDVSSDSQSVKASSYKLSISEFGSDFGDVGRLKHLPNGDISKGQGGHNASQADIDAAAKELIKAGGRNWVPVLVKPTGKYSYEVVGNHFAYDVAKRAGVERIWSVVVPDNPNDVAIAKAQASSR